MSAATEKTVRPRTSNGDVLKAVNDTNALLRDLVNVLTAQHSTPAPVAEAVTKSAPKPTVQHAQSTRTMIEYRKDHSGVIKTATQAQFNVRKAKAENLGHTLTVLRTYEEAVQGKPTTPKASASNKPASTGTGTCQGCGKGGLIANTHCAKCRRAMKG